jgi:hypothetical protein
MSRIYYFWTHGVNVQVEYTEEYIPPRGLEEKIGTRELGLYVRRTGGGVVIRQNGGTWNWFHFAIPTATMIDDEHVDYKNAYLRGRINGKATVTDVHIRHGGVDHQERIWRYTPNLSERIIDESYDIPNEQCTQPMVICVRVEFEPGGEVIFTGAGARMDEQT